MKPLYDHWPFTSDNIIDDKITIYRADGVLWARDKNQIKGLRDRPESLIPSWNNAGSYPADHSSFNIEVESTIRHIAG